MGLSRRSRRREGAANLNPGGSEGSALLEPRGKHGFGCFPSIGARGPYPTPGVFALIVFRGLSRSARSEDPFIRLASAGLVVLFGVQSVINMAVNLNLMPAKGMTLPFISYGGSSMIAVAFGMGLLLAFTRRRPEQRRQIKVFARPPEPAAPAAA